MKNFDFVSPKYLNEVFREIEGKGRNYKLLAGGTNLIPYLREGSLKPKLVVDLSRIKTLNYIKEKENRVRIGALTTINDLLRSSVIKKRVPILFEAATHFAGPVVRNRATVGGNLSDASPAADMAVPLLALKARVKLRSSKGQRTVDLEEFFKGYRKVSLNPGEILTEVTLSVPPPGAKYGYRKLGRRNAMAISVASVALVLYMKGKKCTDATIAVGAVAPTPLRAQKAEEVLKGNMIDVELAQKCGEVVARYINPIDDIRASADYRRQVSEVLVSRVICESLKLDK